MPPALSEDEASASETEIPYKNVDKKPAKDDQSEIGEEDPEDDDEEYGVAKPGYRVDKIISHKSDDRDRIVKYEVKWLGYDAITDRTWEPKDNLWDDDLDCPIEQLQEYWDKHCGGVEPNYMTKKQREKARRDAALAKPANEDTPKSGAGKKRKLSQSTPATPATTKSKGQRKSGRGKQSATPQEDDRPATKTLQLPPGSWETLISEVHTIEEEREEKTGQMTRYAYVEWVDPKRSRSKHSLGVLRIKCPLKLLDYYEQHLVFNPQGEPNGDSDMRAGIDSDMFMDA